MSRFVEVKTAELVGLALDWAVAKALGWKMIPVPADADSKNSGEAFAPPDLGDDFRFPPRGRIGACYFLRKWSTDWAQGGPLLEQLLKTGKWEIVQGIESGAVMIQNYDSECLPVDGVTWCDENLAFESGSLLVAACRAVVAAKLGDVVRVPVELTEVSK